MNILLFGEYSGLHNNLKVGLEKLGHTVKVASSGDSFKKLASDISLGSSSTKLFGKIDRLITPFLKINDFKGFDVTQFINSNPLAPCLVNKFLFTRLFTFSERNYLSACGDDPVFYQNLSKFNYHPYLSIENDGVDHIPLCNKTYVNIHNTFVEKVDGIIPVMLEYAIGYRKYPNIKPTIPLPIETDNIVYNENRIGNKVHFFHGLNRPFFKGTPIIQSALEKLQYKYPNDVKITIAGNMSQKDYLSVLDSANVILDQCKGYSYGMNALYGLAKGKVVMSGSEPEALEELGISKEDCPIINIQPDVNQVYEELIAVLEKRKEIKGLGYDSRNFVEKYHAAEKVAQKYINVWQK
jgi:glycosyltransferase involved in cell wall biosynthesis